MNQAIATRGALFWLFQRLTGIILAVFLFTHVKVLHLDHNFVNEGLIDFSLVTERLAHSMGWVIFYFFFIVSALYHGLNGLWAVVLDFRPSRGIQTTWLSVLWALGILFAIWGLFTLHSFYVGTGGIS